MGPGSGDRLERVSARMGTGRPRLTYLLASAPLLLREAYDLFGQCGAALERFHTRAAMRAAGITVPGRRQATVESEQLLATLIAEGLTNRQIAVVLRLTEDAVANRLSRLFARTGLRSRTEVVTAVLTDYRVRGLTLDAQASTACSAQGTGSAARSPR
ncbi:LuxR C-terminal-related transcriptional regulator [Streptomyces galilaeus]